MGVVRPGSMAQAAFAFSRVRPVTSTCAPRSASTRAVSRPRPEVPPVTSAVRPARSRPAVTSSAVLSAPNGPMGAPGGRCGGLPEILRRV